MLLVWLVWPIAVIAMLGLGLVTWAVADTNSFTRIVAQPVEGVPLGIPLTGWLLLVLLIVILPPIVLTANWFTRRS